MYINTPWNYKDVPPIDLDLPILAVQDLDCSVISALKGGLVELSGEDMSSKSSFDEVDLFADPLDSPTEFQSKSFVDFFDNVRNEKSNDNKSLDVAPISSDNGSDSTTTEEA